MSGDPAASVPCGPAPPWAEGRHQGCRCSLSLVSGGRSVLHIHAPQAFTRIPSAQEVLVEDTGEGKRFSSRLPGSALGPGS